MEVSTKIPPSLKIGGLTWPIVIDPFLAGENRNFGEMRPIQQQIALSAETTPERKAVTLLHEILEVIKNLNDPDLDHETLTILASQLYRTPPGIPLNSFRGAFTRS